jgi:DNA-binding response OmpR family regulator
MKSLIITEDRNFSEELSGLALLVETSGTVSMQKGELSLADLEDRDIALVDGRTDLVAARNWCALLRAAAPLLPVLVVADQSELVAIDGRWCVDDVVVPGLSPAELDMRMRLALTRAAPAKRRKAKSSWGISFWTWPATLHGWRTGR